MDATGVQSVRGIYTYLKSHGYSTQVMGASFRSAAQVTELAVCFSLFAGSDVVCFDFGWWTDGWWVIKRDATF